MPELWARTAIGQCEHACKGTRGIFLFGGNARTDKERRVPLQHGDVVVWGGPARLYHHGVLAVKDGYHEMLGSQRLNLTFRRAT